MDEVLDNIGCDIESCSGEECRKVGRLSALRAMVLARRGCPQLDDETSPASKNTNNTTK